MAEALERFQPRDRADAAGAGRDALLAGDPHLADLAAVADMRASAELAAHLTKRHHPDDVGIFLAEEHHRPLVAGIGQRQEPRADRDGGEDVAVDHRLNRGERFAADGTRVGEVEAEHVGIDLRALLDGVAAEVVLEGGVDQVRRRMGPADRGAPVFVDARGDGGPQIERAAAEVADMEHEAPLTLRVEDLEAPRVGPLPLEPADVADLPPRFTVERRPVEDDGHRRRGIVGGEGVAKLATGDDSEHLSLGGKRVVAEELGAVHCFLEGVERAGGEHLHPVAGARHLPMLVHRGAEAVPVEAAVALGGEGLEELRWEAVGGVEVGCIGAADGPLPRRLQPREELLDPFEAAVDRRQERLFLALDHRGDAFNALGELWVRAGHEARDHPWELVEKGLFHPHLPAVQDGAPQQPLDDVFLLVVPGENVLVDRERASADMVGDPAHPPAVVVGRQILLRADIPHRLDQRPEDVNVEVAVDPLEHGAGPLEPHAGVDVAAGERGEVVGGGALAVELRENEVPDLDIATVGHPVEDLAARAADSVGALAGGAGRPEVVVLAQAADPAVGHADLVGPDPEGLVVVCIDGDREFLGGDVEPALRREELPRPVDRLALEIVAEAEVPQHLEERVVAGGPPDVVDVAGPQTLLASGRLREVELALAEEVILELVHAGRREQHRGIPAGHEDVAGAADAALRFEERQIGFPQFIGLHVGIGSMDTVGDRKGTEE